MNSYGDLAIAFVITMIWGEVLIYLDSKLIPKIEDYFRRRRETNVQRNGVTSHASEGKRERGPESC